MKSDGFNKPDVPTTAEQAILCVFWDHLPKVREFPDRRQTGWGSKTQIGLIATIKRLGADLTEQGG